MVQQIECLSIELEPEFLVLGEPIELWRGAVAAAESDHFDHLAGRGLLCFRPEILTQLKRDPPSKRAAPRAVARLYTNGPVTLITVSRLLSNPVVIV